MGREGGGLFVFSQGAAARPQSVASLGGPEVGQQMRPWLGRGQEPC